MKNTLIDSHAHLISEGVDYLPIINSMNQDKLQTIICVGTSPSDLNEVVELAQKNKNIYATVAYHPEYADEISESDFEMLENLAKNDCVVAIGECGLDYHYRHDNKEKQKEVFLRQIKIALKVQKPIMLHIRDSEQDAIDLLLPYAKKLKNIVVHCYSSVSEEITKKFIGMDAYFGFAGNFTYKKYRREDIKLIPKNRLLVETDSPYLPPEPLRGTQNFPKNVHITAQAMADELQVNADELKRILIENTKRVYGI